MKDKNKGAGKLATYAVIMLLAVIIIIIIAAMADDREQQFQSQIEQTTQTNMTIQNEIVALKDENYFLKQENEELKKSVEASAQADGACALAAEALALLEDGKADEAAAKLAEADKSAFSEDFAKVFAIVEGYVDENN